MLKIKLNKRRPNFRQYLKDRTAQEVISGAGRTAEQHGVSQALQIN
jgi:hypothetical protein